MKQSTALSKTTAAADFAIPVELRLVDEMREHVRGHIRRVNTGFFLIASPVALKPERRLEVTFSGRRIECQVVYCQQEGPNTYALGIRMAQGGGETLRAEPRIPVDLEAKLSMPGGDAPIPGRVVNISASGLGLVMTKEVPTGELAYAELEVGCAFGEIRHCSKTANGYRVGLKLDEFIPKDDEVLGARRRMETTPAPSGFARFFGRKS
jgi:PilZ domain